LRCWLDRRIGLGGHNQGNDTAISHEMPRTTETAVSQQAWDIAVHRQ
jgi:hypothetical protein